MAVAPDFRTCAGLSDKRIALGDIAFQIQPDQLALQHVQFLRGGAVIAFALADEQVALSVKGQARAEVVGSHQLGLLLVDDFQVFQPGRTQGAIGHGGARAAAFAGFGIAQVHALVVGEIGREGHVEQAALAFGEDRGHPGQWGGNAAIGTDLAQASRALGDQQGTIGQEGHGPGVFKAARHLGDFHYAGLAGQCLCRLLAGRGNGRVFGFSGAGGFAGSQRGDDGESKQAGTQGNGHFFISLEVQGMERDLLKERRAYSA